MTVSRETVRPVPLDSLISSLSADLHRLSKNGSGSQCAYLNVHEGLLPFLLLSRHENKASRWVVCTDDYSTRIRLAESLSLLSPGTALHLLDTNTGDEFSGADIHVLNLFSKGHSPFLFLSRDSADSVRAALLGAGARAVPLSNIAKRQTLLNLLSDWGMERTHAVHAPGTFAVRGAVVDLFPFGAAEPLRLEFSDENLLSARSFDPLTQRMLSTIDPHLITLAPPVLPSPPIDGPTPSGDVSVVFLSLQPAGPPRIFHLLQTYGQKDGTVLDLQCVPYRSFVPSPRVFSETLKQLKSNNIVKYNLFLGRAYSSRAMELSLLRPFSLSHHPFKGAFSSRPLACCWVSLDHVIDLPRAPAPPVRGVEDVQDLGDRLEEFPWDEAVVHEDLGIGLYKGLSRVSSGENWSECISLEFMDGDMVHVPLEKLGSVHPYIGSGEKPSLTSLRTGQWQRAKQKARKSVGEIVGQFVEMYSERQRVDGFSFSADNDLHGSLAASFPYSETVDQLKCYEDVKHDMESNTPMDRLICGDVGFGKTEIALRAAFKAVCDDRQVSLLAPTTILANQLYGTFSERLAPLGVSVRLLSRFSKRADVKNVLSGLSATTVDIVIGTHRLFSSDVSIPNLGLIIIDEEHRFGAKHKEMFRIMRSHTDVLSMSATPIPRTLQFSLLGVRDISTLQTPPPGRASVITSVNTFNEEVIRNAIFYEEGREGQVFFVHNNISNINSFAGKIRGLLPGVSVAVAHGRMSNDELESVMLRMIEGDIDVLVSTTIIEAGIDLPNVNTVLINNAHRYGLSQLYQMRGRVGRSSKQAYCYLLVPRRDLTSNAHERLRTIEYNTALGSGYNIALRDLELRGGGNLFGVEQSGHLASVGFHMYCKIVQEAAEERRRKGSGEVPTVAALTSFSVAGDALIPEDYVEEQDDRLYFYRILAAANSTSEINDVADELSDRFGPLPEPATNLLSIKRVRLNSAGRGVESVEARENMATLWLSPNGADTLDAVHAYTDKLRERGLPFTVVNRSGNRSGVSVETDSLRSALEAVEYLFELDTPIC